MITGVGFRGRFGCDPFGDPLVKPNIGAAVAYRLVTAGNQVVLVSRRSEVVTAVADALNRLRPDAVVAAEAVDVTDVEALKNFVTQLPTSEGLSLVHSVGLSSGVYTIRNDNPYNRIEEIDLQTVSAEVQVPLLAFLNTVIVLLPVWKNHPSNRVVVVNSMSAIRAYCRGVSHATSKGALHQAIRSLTLELYKRGIYITEVNPGIVDTGLYDSDEVQAAVREIAITFGQDLTGKPIPMMPPSAVADVVAMVLQNDAHVLQVNLVATGQFPNLGA